MKKIISIIIPFLMIMPLIFSGCSNENSTSGANTTAENIENSTILETKNDKSISVSNGYKGPSDSDVIQEVRSELDTNWDTEYKDMIGDSEIIIEGIVKEVQYISISDSAFTKFDVLVIDSLKGELETGDLVTIYTLGGYISFKDFIEQGNHYERYKDLSEEEINSTVIKQIVDNEEFPVEGEQAIFMLTPSDGVGVEDGTGIAPVGSYWRTCGKYSEFKTSSGFSRNSKSTFSRPNPNEQSDDYQSITKEEIKNFIK